MRRCGAKGCLKAAVARGYCRKHYTRLLRVGDAELVRPSHPERVKPGNRYGLLTVIERVPGGARRMYRCRCDCGGEKSAAGSALTRGRVQSCGCLLPAKHGHTTGGWSPTYNTWVSMLQRCTNPRATYYRYYGGRGIAVCDRWRSFASFLADMGERPAGKSIDRIDTNGDYEPGNCRWATASEQRRNQRRMKAAA